MIRKDKELLKKRGVYAAQGGDYAGELFVFFGKDEQGVYNGLSMPKLECHHVKEEDIKKGLEANVLEFVEKLPKDVYELMYKEYNYRVTIKPIEREAEYEEQDEFDTGWKQSPPQNLLDQPETTEERRSGPDSNRDIHVPKDA